MSETFDHQEGTEYKTLPEIYQIEISAACDLKCPMCLRTTDMERPGKMVRLDLIRKMHGRGDFRGSSFVELQMAGEPTLHPELFQITRYLKEGVGVMVGMSTHGLNLHKPIVLSSIAMMDALTVSVDSLDPETYSQMRVPAKLDDLLINLDELFTFVRHRISHKLHYPFIELQLVKTAMFEKSGDLAALQALINEKKWNGLCEIRTTSDSFAEMQGRVAPGTNKRNMSICLNPFRSVSVLHTGDVVSCCYIFDLKKDEINWYGNLNDQSLEEIWHGPRVEAMRQSHLTKELSGECRKCYLWSPSEIHSNIVSRLVRNRKG